jgi:hypothetical protein
LTHGCKGSNYVDGYDFGMSLFSFSPDTAYGIIMFALYAGTLFHAAWAGSMGSAQSIFLEYIWTPLN